MDSAVDGSSVKTGKTTNILIGCTGSVATIKLPELVRRFSELPGCSVRVVCTENARHFFEPTDVPADVPVLGDADEWSAWRGRGDPVLHIELNRWADVLVLAPLDANTLAKMANGLCDNLLLCSVRAWTITKPLFFCPAMNTKMWEHPVTAEHVQRLRGWGYREIGCVEKTLMCGDTGLGAMAAVDTIVATVRTEMGL